MSGLLPLVIFALPASLKAAAALVAAIRAKKEDLPAIVRGLNEPHDNDHVDGDDHYGDDSGKSPPSLPKS